MWLRPQTPMAAVLCSAASLTSDVDGLKRALETTLEERYRIERARRRR